MLDTSRNFALYFCSRLHLTHVPVIHSNIGLKNKKYIYIA